MDVYLFMLANNSDIITKEVCGVLLVAMQCGTKNSNKSL